MDDDSFEIEITDLDGGQPSAPRRWLPHPPMEQPPDDESFQIGVTDLRAEPDVPPLAGEQAEWSSGWDAKPPQQPLSPLAPRPHRRARLLGGVSAATALVMALAAVLIGSPVARGHLGPLFATPIPTTPGSDVLQLVNEAPWGKLTADGHTIIHSRFGGHQTFIHLDGGTHQLSFVAPPFPDLRCQVSVPAAASDTCPLVQFASSVSFGGPNDGQTTLLEGVRVLDLRATVDHLSPEQRGQLIAATRTLFAGVQQRTTVNPGEHYLAADQSIRVAHSALTVTQTIELNAELKSEISINGESCAMICSVPVPADLFGGWTFQATATLIWQFTDARGALVTESIPQALADAPVAVTWIPLIATWHGAWQVSFPNMASVETGLAMSAGDPASGEAAQVLCNLAQVAASRQKTPSTSYGSIGWAGTPANPADGCVTVNQATSPTSQLVGHPELLLYRFGVLLAAGAEASQLNPGLPVADASELVLAQQAAAASEPPQFTNFGSG